MDLAWNETQQMLKSSARSLLAKECPLSTVRALEKDDKGYSPQLWRHMAESGWLGLAFPEKYGGAGGDFLDLAALLEEMGRMLTPSPLLSTVLGGLAILDVATEAVKKDLLPQIVQGRTIVALAVLEPSGSWDPSAIQLKAERGADAFILTGTKLFVPDAHAADYFVVPARTSYEDSLEDDGITLFMVPKDARGLRISPHHTLAGDKEGQLDFTGVRVARQWLLGEVDKGWPVLTVAIARGSAGKCVEMAGGAQAVLEMTLDYLKHRVQFGRPVATFQALQHHLANMAMDVEGCQSIAHQAAWRVAEGNFWSPDILQAKLWCNEAYNRVCALAHQCHGAMGFTWEYDLQLYTRRAKVQEQAFGDAMFNRQMLAQMLSFI